MRVSDKFIFILLCILLATFNLKNILLPAQIIYTLKFVDFKSSNIFYPTIKVISDNRNLFENEKNIGFLSDIPEDKIFRNPQSIVNFYLVQYCISPAILQTDTKQNKLIAVFYKPIQIPSGYKVDKKLSENIWVLRRAAK